MTAFTESHPHEAISVEDGRHRDGDHPDQFQPLRRASLHCANALSHACTLASHPSVHFWKHTPSLSDHACSTLVDIEIVFYQHNNTEQGELGSVMVSRFSANLHLIGKVSTCSGHRREKQVSCVINSHYLGGLHINTTF